MISLNPVIATKNPRRSRGLMKWRGGDLNSRPSGYEYDDELLRSQL
jgi:hypothetical protein